MTEVRGKKDVMRNKAVMGRQNLSIGYYTICILSTKDLKPELLDYNAPPDYHTLKPPRPLLPSFPKVSQRQLPLFVKQGAC